MRRILSIFVLIFFTAVYLLSSNDYMMKKIAPSRYEMTNLFGSDKYRYGDLFGLCYLKDFKIESEKEPPILSSCKKPGNVNLYLICDSYLWSFIKTDSIFCNVNKMRYARWLYNERIEEKLDTTHRNILIIESSERFARKLLKDTLDMYSSMRVSKRVEKSNFSESETLWDKILRYLYNENVNQNLEFNLFDYRFLTPVKELKAELNYRVFGRINNDVSISTDKNYLLYGPTTDSTKNTSSFNHVNDKEVSELISNLNIEYKYFRALGFDEVYLSLIPNPVSIINPDFGNYNYLIARIQQRKDRLIPIIDTYDLFKTVQYPIYYKSDSHWNYDGFQLWVNQTNKMLSKY